MNFYELFEKKETDHQDVTIADPKAALALKQARNKYSYADSDLEAFVKMTQDQDEQEEDEIAQLEKDTARQEKLIKQNIDQLEKNQQTIQRTRDLANAAKERADNLERENKIQNQNLVSLRAKEKDYEQYINTLHNELQDLENRLAGLKSLQGEFKAKTITKPSISKTSEPENDIFQELPGLRS